MRCQALEVEGGALAELRARYLRELDCQAIHESIHRRPGWTRSFVLQFDGAACGFATLAIAGPWRDEPTLLEFYVVPERHDCLFALFEALLAATAARRVETQSNGSALALVLPAYAQSVQSEKILFRDAHTTALSQAGAVVMRVTAAADERAAFERRSGASEWLLEVDGTRVGKGGFACHYNAPYCDVYVEIDPAHRRRGLGAYFVQELKRACRTLGGIPAARCSPANVASRQMCQRAGFAPCGHVLVGMLSGQPTR